MLEPVDQIIPSAPPTEHIQEFSTECKALLRRLEGYNDALKFGPLYSTLTSRNQKIAVNVIYYDLPQYNSNFSRIIFLRRIILLAQDGLGNFIGFKEAMLSHNPRIGLTVDGHMQILRRGEGVATTIDLVLADVLQKEAQSRRAQVTHTITDLNPYREPEEHKRWLSLYGPDGLLGFDKRGQKKILPNGERDIGLDCFDEIDLRRKEVMENGRRLIRPLVIRETTATPLLTQQQKADNFQRVLSPRLKGIVVR